MAEKTNDFKFDEGDIGVFLMESITTGLYKNPMNVLREYISNEIDNDPPPEIIEVKVDANKIMISGDGPGMDFDGIRQAVKVGFSTKNLRDNIGFRGIGIYAGVALCNRIVITTKKRENPKYYTIHLDCKGLKTDISEGGTVSLISSLEKNVKWSENTAPPEKKDYHGTVAFLMEIQEDFRDVLNEDKLRKYLEMTVPLEFNPGFLHRTAIKSYLRKSLANDFKVVQLKLNDSPVYRAPFYDALEPQITGKISADGKTLAVYWICQNSRTGKIPDEFSRGLIYRKKGFTVGDRTTITRLFLAEKNKHLIDYICGEVHVVDDNLLPNTERVEFEPSPARDELERAIAKVLGKEITNIARKKSAVSRAEQRIEQAEGLPNTPKFETKEDWIRGLTDARKLLDGLKTDTKPRNLLPSNLKTKAERATKRTEAWIDSNSTTPKEFSAQPEEKKEKPKEPEKPEKDERQTPKLRTDWVDGAVSDMCERTGYKDECELIHKFIEVLLSEGILSNDDQVRSLLQSLELKLTE